MPNAPANARPNNGPRAATDAAEQGRGKVMGVSRLVCIGGLAFAIAACGGEKKDEAAEAAAAVPAKLAGGLYEVSAEVTQLASTDNTTPAAKLKQGDKQVVK